MKLEFVKPKEERVIVGKVGDRLRFTDLDGTHSVKYEFTVISIEDCPWCQDKINCPHKTMGGKDIVGLGRDPFPYFCSAHKPTSWIWTKIN